MIPTSTFVDRNGRLEFRAWGSSCSCMTKNRRAVDTVGLQADHKADRENCQRSLVVRYRVLASQNMRLINSLRQQLRRHSTLTEQRRVETKAQDEELSFAKAAEVLWSPAEGPSRLGSVHRCDTSGTSLIGTVTNGGSKHQG